MAHIKQINIPLCIIAQRGGSHQTNKHTSMYCSTAGWLTSDVPLCIIGQRDGSHQTNKHTTMYCSTVGWLTSNK